MRAFKSASGRGTLQRMSTLVASATAPGATGTLAHAGTATKCSSIVAHNSNLPLTRDKISHAAPSAHFVGVGEGPKMSPTDTSCGESYMAAMLRLAASFRAVSLCSQQTRRLRHPPQEAVLPAGSRVASAGKRWRGCVSIARSRIHCRPHPFMQEASIAHTVRLRAR